VDSTDNLGQKFTESHRIELKAKGNSSKITDILKKIDGVKSVDGGAGAAVSAAGFTIEVEKDKDIRAEVARRIVEGGFDLLELRYKSMSLEDVFLRLVTEEEGER
jgi:ABC-2 type transport system ATP-binding protein